MNTTKQLKRLLYGVCWLTVAHVQIAAANTDVAADTMEWQFRVFLDKKAIGSHDFRVTANGNEQRVETEAGFDVKVLFINAYRYRHQNVEIWQDDCLTGIDANTDANGDLFSVSGRASDEGFQVSTGEGTESLPECVMSFAYWNPAFLQADRLLNSQTGEYEQVEIVPMGVESVDVNGTATAANRYEIVLDKGTISVWYSTQDQRWLALDAPAKGGRRIRYEALKVPPADLFVSATQTLSSLKLAPTREPLELNVKKQTSNDS